MKVRSFMNKKECTLLSNFPKHKDNLKIQLKNNSEYAKMWLDSILEDYLKEYILFYS